MSGGLHLRVNLSFRGEDLVAGANVLANVYPVEHDMKGMRDILIPAGDKVVPKRFDVAPGRYVVEVVMPSGRLLTEEAQVGEGEEVTLDIDDWDSPHESHSWQYFSGNLEPGRVYHDPSTIALARSTGSRALDYLDMDLGASFDETSRSVLRQSVVATPKVFWVPDSRTQGWSFEQLNQLSEKMTRADPDRISALVAEGTPIPVPAPTESDGASHLYRFERSGPKTIGMSGPPASVQTGARQFLIVSGVKDAFLVTLPTPWMDVHYKEVQVEVLVDARPSPTGGPVGVTVRDRALGAGLGYLASGALSAAARVFQDVEEMLYGKIANPLAAAAGAYVLVGTEKDRDPKRWHSWLDHLRSWFGWMSDGSILWAVHTLRSGSEARISDARDALLEGYERGIPFYTLGLSWLIDGLSDFPEDQECRRALEQVRRLSWRVNTRQPFVVLGLNRRAM